MKMTVSNIGGTDSEFQRLRRNQRSLESEVNTLQRVLEFNEEILEDTGADTAMALRIDGETESSSTVTDQLLDDQQSRRYYFG